VRRALLVLIAAITCSSKRFCRRCSVIIVVRFSLKLLSLFCSLGDNGLVDVLKTFDDLDADGGGGGKLLLMFDSTHRLGSLTIG
jgi:hypothetical protein